PVWTANSDASALTPWVPTALRNEQTVSSHTAAGSLREGALSDSVAAVGRGTGVGGDACVIRVTTNQAMTSMTPQMTANISPTPVHPSALPTMGTVRPQKSSPNWTPDCLSPIHIPRCASGTSEAMILFVTGFDTAWAGPAMTAAVSRAAEVGEGVLSREARVMRPEARVSC